MDQAAVNKLIKASRAFAARLDRSLKGATRNSESERWVDDYRQLGERVAELLWPNTFGKLYDYALGATNGNVTVTFNLDRSWFDGAWEAIYDEHMDRFVMLEATVVRTVRQRLVSGHAPDRIRTKGGACNVLVIQSQVSDNSSIQGPDDPMWRKFVGRSTISELGHLEDEVHMLRGLESEERSSRAQFMLHILAPRGASLADEVRHHLEDRSYQYDIIHFVGHTLVVGGSDPQDTRSYLVFSGAPGVAPRAVPVASFAHWLKGAGVQLVYLSCPHTSSAAAALELAASDVPITIGFNWGLDDRSAVDFAKAFYSELLTTWPQVSPAVSKARRNLYSPSHRGDLSWAAPVLIAQARE